MKDIQGYEGLYAVTSCGKVWSYKRKIFLKPVTLKTNYQQVTLSKDGKMKHYYVHRLVAAAFLPNPTGLPEVNHKNKVRTDNYMNNLEWCDRKYNIQYSKAKKVLCIETNQEFVGAREAGRSLGICETSISKCCLGKQKTAGGYHFRYVEEE